jgi:hypothetical protein
MRKLVLFLLMAAAAVTFSACGAGGTAPASNVATAATPYKGFTAADVAKLKWIEGTWRGMDGEKPFFERYRLDGTTLIVENFEDGTLAKATDTTRFELRDGEFGKFEGEGRSAASSITDTSVQFVPVGKGNAFRFERQPDGTWNAVLDRPAADGKPAGQKIYKMEPWKGEGK